MTGKLWIIFPCACFLTTSKNIAVILKQRATVILWKYLQTYQSKPYSIVLYILLNMQNIFRKDRFIHTLSLYVYKYIYDLQECAKIFQSRSKLYFLRELRLFQLHWNWKWGSKVLRIERHKKYPHHRYRPFKNVFTRRKLKTVFHNLFFE